MTKRPECNEVPEPELANQALELSVRIGPSEAAGRVGLRWMTFGAIAVSLPVPAAALEIARTFLALEAANV
jgi:hypothetical protein